MLIKAKSIEGYSLHGLDGAFGKVRDLYFDDARWTIRYLVVDTMNWMEDRAVLISPYALIGLYAGKKLIRTSLTMKQIEESPSAKTDEPVSMQFEESYHAFFGWPDYWRGSSVWGDSAIIARRPEERRNENQGGKPWDHHLRSVSAVVGYGIHARDGELG
ncbi:MAG: hypothetical protein Q8M76_04005, partial [Spirochaetaceae bacterium]|nr:hypothetical protein [Spirochaetaceae bacterium]